MDTDLGSVAAALCVTVGGLLGLVVGFALTGAKAGERETLVGILSDLQRSPGRVVIADKAYFGKGVESALAAEDVVLLRQARKGEPPRPGIRFFKPLRQVIESINDTFNTQLSLELHGGNRR
ncbi:MAG: transposase [Bifidobacteriaceae bacterium]|jgi:hypothetical protein|nr:transposase [Bifidobacteriaceae bacterium]